MATSDLFQPLTFARGGAMKNRFMLAPLTNQQSHDDGRLSDDEFRWLLLRAQGGFGLTMTCAASVQEQGRGFRGQLGVHSDDHIEGLTRLATAIRATGSLSAMQIHHAGNRSPADLVSEVVSSSDDPKTGARGLSTSEVEALVEDFVAGAVRADRAGFDGVEIHGAHGYMVTQFLSAGMNHRTDRYGGSLENRWRFLFEVLAGIRARCRADFQLGLRLSPERFGLKLAETIETVREVIRRGEVDYLDMSLWDVRKEPNEEEFQGRTLMSYFTELERGPVRLGVAGKLMTAQSAAEMLDAGADFVLIGKGAILHHDFVARAHREPGFQAQPLPVSRDYLAGQGLNPTFVEYMTTFAGFVEEA